MDITYKALFTHCFSKDKIDANEIPTSPVLVGYFFIFRKISLILIYIIFRIKYNDR